MVDRALTPVVDQFGSSFKLNAIDIRTQAIPTQKENGTITPGGAFAALPGHTCDVGVLVKNTASVTSVVFIKHTGATAANNGFHLRSGEEVFIPTQQLSQVQHKATGVGTLSLSYKAY